MFTYGSMAAGAWNGQVVQYLCLYVPFAPVLLLFVLWLRWVMSRAL